MYSLSFGLFLQVSFEGGSGPILFDVNGDRPGYSAIINNINTLIGTSASRPYAVWTAAAWNIDPVSLEVTETQYNTRPLPGDMNVPGYFAYAPINFYNERL